MSFNKAESTNATSGYWRWVGDVEHMQKQQAKVPPPWMAKKKKFKMNATEAATAELDHEWLLAQTRAMNESSSTEASGRANRRDTYVPGYLLCADIIERQDEAKYAADVEKWERREQRRYDEDMDRRKNAMSNMRRATHSAPFRPTANKKTSKPFVDEAKYRGGMVGVEEYNITKRGFFHSMDNNHRGDVHQLLDQENKHVEGLNYLVVRHDPLPNGGHSTVPVRAPHARTAE